MASQHNPHPIGYVYIFLREDGLRKLGYSIDVRQRRINCSMEMNVRCEIEAHWETDERTASLVERAVHNKLRCLKVRGHSSIELYNLPLKRLSQEVEAAFGTLGVKPTSRWGNHQISKTRFQFENGRNRGLAEAAQFVDSLGDKYVEWEYRFARRMFYALAQEIRGLQRKPSAIRKITERGARLPTNDLTQCSQRAEASEFQRWMEEMIAPNEDDESQTPATAQEQAA